MTTALKGPPTTIALATIAEARKITPRNVPYLICAAATHATEGR